MTRLLITRGLPAYLAGRMLPLPVPGAAPIPYGDPLPYGDFLLYAETGDPER
ncbi:hypothetical protein [Paractinoplanes maris]|uniref:hypothetical protein n=1 Tax=Paractinoplanes maris TaxID=1734446 RepID=UPI002021C578|nr:hypothetical protein [Actinoplanes maris]